MSARLAKNLASWVQKNDRGENPVPDTRDTTGQTPEVSYRNLVQMPPVLVPALG